MNEQDRVFVKCAWRLLPFLGLLYLVNFFDRVNVGFAALTMNKDLGFSPSVFGFGAGVLFFGIFLFSIPSSVLLERFGARRWLCWTSVAWGLLSAGNAFVRDPISFYLLRFLLGAAEAGFIPGVLFYLTCWFPHAYRARVMAGFLAFAPLAVIVGGPISGFILGIGDLASLHSWQLLFLIEGLPAFLLSFAVLKLLPDRPAFASWLTEEEKAVILTRLGSEPPAEHRDLWPALCDLRVLALGLAEFGILAGAYGIGLWLPQMVRGMGYSNLTTGFVVALLEAASVVGMISWGRSSDRTGERIWHLILPTLLAAAGVGVASVSPSNLISLAAFAAALTGIRATYGPVVSLVSSFLTGPAAAGGMALVYAMGNLGAFLGPTFVGLLKEMTGDYAAAMGALSLALILSAAIVLAVGRVMAQRVIFLQSQI
jgi:MFS transporter, ACS family, tartrate transporter